MLTVDEAAVTGGAQKFGQLAAENDWGFYCLTTRTGCMAL